MADKVVELVLSLSHETVRLRLKKHSQDLAETVRQRRMHFPYERGVCGGTLIQYEADVLDLYGESYDPNVRWCASTRPPPSCWPMCKSPCPPSRDDPVGRTTSIGAAAPATSS